MKKKQTKTQSLGLLSLGRLGNGLDAHSIITIAPLVTHIYL